jgi:putative flippase GtrA
MERTEARSEERTHAVPRSRLAAGLTSPLGGRLLRFAVIGVGSTVLNLGLLALLHAPLGAQAANLVGLVVSTVANTAANRAWTFGVRGAGGMARQHLQALAVFGLTWALSSGALLLLTALDPQASTVAAVLVVAAANLVSTVVRFAAMRTWIFRTGT